MIKAILFDLGNVIVPIDFRRCHQELAKVCSYPPEEVPRRIRSTGLVEVFEKGEVPPERFVDAVCRVLDLRVSSTQFWDMWSSIFAPEPLLAEGFLQGLRRRHRLLVLSNTNVIHFAMVQERYTALRHFDGFVLSYEVGALKPSPEIYQQAIARAGCEPAECFFTDDIAAYVAAARRAGMDAVQFEGQDQLERDLRVRGVVW